MTYTMRNKPTATFPHCTGGTVSQFTFPNGYTASLAETGMAYGGREIGVLHNGELVYDTPITSDVLGHLTPEEADDIIDQIAALPPRGPEAAAQ